jgi:hypothetical protein
MNNYKEEDIYEKIAKVVHLICNNPAVYFSEMDIHVLMTKALMEIDCFNPFACPNKGLIPTACTIGIGKNNKEASPSGEMYQTMLVHKEYGHRDDPNARSDIVIFDEQDVKSIDDPINLKKKNEYLTPKYIFEFGTEKVSGEKGKKYTDHIANDLKKLSKCSGGGRGFLIHIHRNYVQSENKETLEKYQNEIKEVWEGVEGKGKVKILVFFVDIGGKNRVIERKVQMFNPYPKSKTADWPYVNLKKIEEIIKKFLKEKTPDLAEIK